MKEPYVFKGLNANNYITYNGKSYRIYFVDTDDSLVLVSENSFGTTFSGKTQNICGLLPSDYSLYKFPDEWGIEAPETFYKSSSDCKDKCSGGECFSYDKIKNGEGSNLLELEYNKFYCSNDLAKFYYVTNQYTSSQIIYDRATTNSGYVVKYDENVDNVLTINLNAGGNCSNNSEKLVSFNDYWNTYEFKYNRTYFDSGVDVAIGNATAEDYYYHIFMRDNSFIPGFRVQKVEKIYPYISLSIRKALRNDETNYMIGYKIRLKSCMKITSGTGNPATPYILEDKC